MLRLDKVIKPWKESAALNDHINLYGFWNETAFLTKSGDVGMILSVPGVDYESLDRSQQEYAVKRLEAALKTFGPGFHVYQYLFKSNRPDIPFATYDDPIVAAAIDQRRKFFEAKRDHLYQVEIFYCILLEGARSKTGVGTALARLLRDPEGAITELKSQFTKDSMKKLLRAHIDHDLQRLDPTIVINNVTALARTAKAYGIPTILTTVNEERGGLIFKQVQAVFPDQKTINRTFINAWEDRRVAEAVKKTGRKKLVIAALWTEMCLAMPAIHAMGDGYDVYIVTDASGGASPEAHDMAIRRMVSAGAQPITWLGLAGELQRDWARTEHLGEVAQLFIDHAGATGSVFLWETQLLAAPQLKGA